MAIRVLVVDDSAFMRRVLSDVLSAASDIDVVGQATDGLDALLQAERLRPDVVTMDVEMPRMDGLTALRHLLRRYPCAVVMVSSLTQEGASVTLRALASGAVDFVAKPSGSISLDFRTVGDDLVHKVRIAARARVPTAPLAAVGCTSAPSRATTGEAGVLEQVVVIGASTGGPRALASVVPRLPVVPGVGYLVVQHMPAGFTRSLADHLDALGPLPVAEAVDGTLITPGRVLVAPGDFHLRLTSLGRVQLDQGPRMHGVRPAVDHALTSAAAAFGRRTVAAILTGMGVDGADGAAVVHAAGGQVIAEDASTCVVWGMPRAVVERGLADWVVPLEGIPEAIARGVARVQPRARAGVGR